MYTFIYTLSDKTGIRYVGKSNNPIIRFKVHLKECKRRHTRKEKWIYSLMSNKELPILEILDEVLIEEWEVHEEYWICQFRAWGFDIVNGTDGGEGSNGFKGRKHSKQTIEKIKSARKLQSNIKSVRGSKNVQSRLTEEQVLEIRTKSNIFSRSELANEYKVSRTTITNIVNGRKWKYCR